VAYKRGDLIDDCQAEPYIRIRLYLTGQAGLTDAECVRVPVAVDGHRKRRKAELANMQGIGISVPGRTFDLFRRLFYVAGIVPSDGGAKQLSQ
jgi:hypothetical protein